ncbi:MIP/aquaporin family protein [Oceanivirga salmonicida]|uniref:MIP/aquaporin family protein n=1 Tax=Oceanivirga salmonicida TaxID=1769291 RepID=UPI00083162CB|nr:MIP/aquaporin family protein [Oceanivirga salmonicida]
MSIFLAEFIGTALLILLGNGVVAACLLNKSKAKDSGWIVITSGWAFAVLIGAYSVGRFSGAHINPAVSLALFTIGVITFNQLIVYVAAQFLGAMLGQLLVVVTYKQHYDETENTDLVLATFSTGPAIRNLFYNTITEIIGTFVLVFGILMIGPHFAKEGSFFTIFIVALLVWSIGLSLGGPTGYAINPARDLGPRIIHQLLPLKHKGKSDWGYALVPVIGPLLGGVLAGLAFMALGV